MLPNFLIIGAGKSGTSSLYEYLKQHPQVYMSPLKEPCFFAYEDEDLRAYPGMNWLPEALARHGVRVEGNYTLGAYRRLFDGVSGETAIGEASTHYLYREKAALRIRHHVPDVKLIAIFRQPADKAFSQFLMCVRDGREPHQDFEMALEQEGKRIRDGWDPCYHYLRTGFYFEQLNRYFGLFDRDQIRVYLYEDLQRNGADVVRDLYGFLGVDDTFVPDVSRRYNVSGIPRSRLLYRLIRRPHPFKSAVKAVLPRRLQVAIGRDLLGLVERLTSTKPRIPPEVRARLTELYREDILRLEELIGRDLGRWLEPSGVVEAADPAAK